MVMMAEEKKCPKCETPMILNKSGCCTKTWICPNKDCRYKMPYK